jgi:hypothetical protein
MPFAADAGALAALGGQDVKGAGVDVTPAQASLQPSGRHGVVRVIGAAVTKVRTGPVCASAGLAQDALADVKHISAFSRWAQRRMAGVLFAHRLSTGLLAAWLVRQAPPPPAPGRGADLAKRPRRFASQAIGHRLCMISGRWVPGRGGRR